VSHRCYRICGSKFNEGNYDSGNGGNHWSVVCSHRNLSRDMEERTEITVKRHFVHRRPVNPQCGKDRNKCFHAAESSGGQYRFTSDLQEQVISDTTSRTTHLLENRSREGWISSLEQHNGFQEILNLDEAIDDNAAV
jgi:DNA primase catalytic subunit